MIGMFCLLFKSTKYPVRACLCAYYISGVSKRGYGVVNLPKNC